MRKRVLLIISFFIWVAVCPVIAQKQANIWYFGNFAGLDFNTTPVSFETGSHMASQEGCATICDTSGSLLFYTNGIDIWDRSHAKMSNGTGLLGHQSSTQSGVIIPFPGNPDKHYVFTVDEHSIFPWAPPHRGFHYSVVDMNGNGGMGSVTNKNIQLLSKTAEKVTGVSHCNSGDVWVITHGWDNNDFYAYLITNSGLNTTPVISSVGAIHGSHTSNAVGYMKASPDGTKLACAMSGLQQVELFDFDAETGQISNPTTFNFPASFGPYGLEFSPSGNILYVGGCNQGLRQIEISTGIQRTINSGVCVNAMQLGPNDKIYTTRLGVINNPEVIGTACNFTGSGISFAAGTSPTEGLPTFNQSLFKLATYQRFEFSDTCFNDSTKFTFFSNVVVDSLVWNFGDTLSADSIARGPDVSHVFTEVDRYKVILKVYNLNCPIPFILEQEIGIAPLPEIEIGEDTIICDYDLLDLRWEGEHIKSFLWHTGNDSDTVITNVPGPGNFFVTGFNECGLVTDYMDVGVYREIDVEIPDARLCDGDSILLDAYFPDATYRWQNGDTLPIFNAKTPGIYTVRITTECYTKDLRINILEDVGPPYLELGNDTTICAGDSLLLDIGYLSSTYLWFNGDTDSVFVVTDAGQYFVEVTLSCYTAYDTINVELHELAEVDIGNDTSVCFDQIFEIRPESNERNFRWQDGSTFNTFTAESPGVYTVSVSNICNEAVDSMRLSHDQPPEANLPEDTILCEGSSLILNAWFPGSSYFWQDQSRKPYYKVEEAGIYYVTVANSCGRERDMVEVETKDCECTVFLPNAFTPNGDQHNNYFEVKYDCEIQRFHIQIFNRWGELVYESRNPDAQWNGRDANGNFVQNGAYVYKLFYTGMRDNEPFDKTKRGQVIVLR